MASGGAQLLQEVALDDDYREQEKYDNLADIFAIIRTLQFLETAFTRDTISNADYERECDKLLLNYETAIRNCEDFNIDEFVQTYQFACAQAKYRIKCGMNAVRETGLGVQHDSGATKAKIATECTEKLLTLIDAIELLGTAKEELKPKLTELLDIHNKMTNLPPSYKGRDTLLKWLAKYGPMGALDELSDTDKAEFEMDLQEQYQEFKKAL